MSLSSLRKLPLKKNMPVLAGVVLVFGLFGLVMMTQQEQDTRSRAGVGGTGNCATVNPSSGENLSSDNCTIQSGFNGSIFGNNNTIMGGLGGPVANITGNGNLIMGGSNGSINGSGNEICGGLNGGITGNNNIIHGGVGGPINGTGNVINFSGPCGVIRQSPPPSQPPTAPPTQPPATCADGIDNNQNELIDGGDPVCHTDGNQNNPNSYDPSRNEGAITITQPPVTPSLTPSAPPTVPPTAPPSVGPSITVPPGNSSIKLDLLLHGIGKGGDSANPNSGGNPNPLHPQRSVKVQIYNSQNQLVLTKDGTVNYNSGSGSFAGTIDIGNTLVTGAYNVKVKSVQYLRSLVPGIQNLTAGVVNNLPTTIMIAGNVYNPEDPELNYDKVDNTTLEKIQQCYSDINPPQSTCSNQDKVNADLNNDGNVTNVDYNLYVRYISNSSINILDYNVLMGCYSGSLPPTSCTPPNDRLSDLDDDGDVNQYDYNLFLREITNRAGQ